MDFRIHKRLPWNVGGILACSNHLHQGNTLHLPKSRPQRYAKHVCEFSHQKWWFRCQVMTQDDYGTPDKRALLEIDLPNQNHPRAGHVLV